ncbi:hypothetical protein AVEN_14798-1 [Araneus ventricosus]|uniref:Uncharacterized protein n=1 Tax=Araneus ventricosus TaxID=182803 RepID=A0A4Y2FK92_ARAVE|nr:hypothetical protein AVEN_14798-1 [Araneus ventricosus]
MEAPCKPHNRSIQPLWATVPTPPSTFKTEPPPHFTPLPHFVVFAFLREYRSPSPISYSNFMTECVKWKTNDFGYPNFSTSTVQFSSDIRFDAGFGERCSKWCGAECS